MTGRQDISPAASVKLEQIHKDSQGQEEFIKRQDSVKQTKRSGLIKSPKPPMELYSPRKILQKNGTKVHFVEGNNVPRKSSSPPNNSPTELKSALKRSKSFTMNDANEFEAMGFERDSFPMENLGLIRRAILDPNTLPCQKLMELVRLICSKAVENIQYSAPAAQLCFSIIDKEHDHTFLESLQNCCREWFNERDKLLRSSFLVSHRTTSNLQRWTAYLLFLTELYLRVKSQHCQAIQTTETGSTTVQMLGPHPNSPMGHLALTLQTLLFECANILLKPPSLHNEGEIEILRKILNMVGQELEKDASQRMQLLVCNLRDAFINPSINAHIRKTLLELIELHASGWQLDLPQNVYYFPYTAAL